ncbi:MAG: hypothetical protein ACO1NZ_11805 [Adhaeribacter sp.]
MLSPALCFLLPGLPGFLFLSESRIDADFTDYADFLSHLNPSAVRALVWRGSYFRARDYHYWLKIVSKVFNKDKSVTCLSACLERHGSNFRAIGANPEQRYSGRHYRQTWSFCTPQGETLLHFNHQLRFAKLAVLEDFYNS